MTWLLLTSKEEETMLYLLIEPEKSFASTNLETNHHLHGQQWLNSLRNYIASMGMDLWLAGLADKYLDGSFAG